MQAAAEEVSRTQPTRALALEHESQARLTKLGVKFVTDVDKSGLIAAALPFQDRLAAELGPHAVKVLGLVRAVK